MTSDRQPDDVALAITEISRCQKVKNLVVIYTGKPTMIMGTRAHRSHTRLEVVRHGRTVM